ncbi:MAG TPA: HAMP domain-containing sensor histidine kinase [Actinocrinis sp.]
MLTAVRSTVRGRLALVGGALFLASGAVLLAITYFLVGTTFPAQTVRQLVAGPGSPGTGTVVSGVIQNSSGVIESGGGQPGSRSDATAMTGTASASGKTLLVSQLRTEELNHLLIVCSEALGLMAVLSVALGWILAGRALRPLRVVTAATRRISEDSLHRRLAVSGPRDELKDLADTIDGLLGRLEAAFDAQRRFIANASHELRTPLTVGRTLLEMVLGDPDASIESFRSVCADVLESEFEQERLIEALLTLARGQRGLDRREPVDLAEIGAAALRTREPAAEAKGLTVRAALRPAPCSGDPQLMGRLLANLVDNAIRHNTADGWIELATGTRDGRATLAVRNSGPVVPPAEVDRLFLPFQRLDGARTHQEGHGLGLSIVQAIADAHGAELHAEPEPAGGLRIEVTLPASVRDSAQDDRDDQDEAGEADADADALGWPTGKVGTVA